MPSERRRFRAPVLAAVILAALGSGLAAQAGTPVPSPAAPRATKERLANGLEVYVLPEAEASTARIQLCFKAGAVSQTAENAGQFRLLERLTLESLAEDPDSPLRRRLLELEAEEWGSGTAAEATSFWLGLPSGRAGEGMALLAELAAGAEIPGIAGLETERARLLAPLASEPLGGDRLLEAAVTRRLFSRYPWRRDPAGSPAGIAAATEAGLRKLKGTWYLPNNAVLVIGGGIEPEAALEAARAAFGAWRAGPDPWKSPLPPQPKPGVARPTWIALPDPGLPEGLGLVELRYRGPDLGADRPGALAAELFAALLSPPEGRFKRSLKETVPGLAGEDPVSAYYLGQRDGAVFAFSAFIEIAPGSAADRTRSFKERARAFEMTAMKTDGRYFSAPEWEQAKERVLAARAGSLELARDLVPALALAWAQGVADQLLAFPEQIAKTGAKEVQAFLDAYIHRNLEIVALRLNPADLERERKALAAAGFEAIPPGPAFWWKR